MSKTKKDAPKGMSLMKAPKNSGGFSWAGEQYVPEDGYILIPSQAAEEARNHGFTDADEA